MAFSERLTVIMWYKIKCWNYYLWKHMSVNNSGGCLKKEREITWLITAACTAKNMSNLYRWYYISTIYKYIEVKLEKSAALGFYRVYWFNLIEIWINQIQTYNKYINRRFSSTQHVVIPYNLSLWIFRFIQPVTETWNSASDITCPNM